jgi:hypothetical protein
VARYVPSADAKKLLTLGDALGEQLRCGVAVVGTAGADTGALLAVVSGDPTAPGVCTMELIMPDGATGSRHTTIRTTSTSKSGRER